MITGFAPILEELGFYWFEEAFGGTNSEHIDLFVELNEAMPTVMVSGGERFLERFESQVWLDRGALDIIQTDCNVAGLTENWYIARMAHLRGKLAIPHNWHGGGTTMANAHYVAAIPNRDYCELNQTRNPLKEEIFKEPLTEKKFPYVPGSYSKPSERLPG